MIFKLIIQRYKFPQIKIHNPPSGGKKALLPIEYTQTLMKIYAEHDIYYIGYWQDVNDPHIEYVLNVYQSEEHYQKFITTMSENEFYKDLSQRLVKLREWIKIISLKLDETAPILPDLVGVQGYIDMVKNLIELRDQ